MIIIDTPKITYNTNDVIIGSQLIISNSTKYLWYKFPLKYKEYLVFEQLDAFVIGLLLLGLKTGQDIKLNGILSERLYYTLTHYLIPALLTANPLFKKIKIIHNGLSRENLNKMKSTGTGMSCGVDSLSTYFDHKNEKGSFKISHFTYFNVGSHLDFGGEKSRNIFHRRLKSVEEFSINENKFLIPIDSNLSEILQMNFQQSHTLRNISCVLHLQKLFSTYYYSSANKFDFYQLKKRDMADYDILTLYLLSTESLQFFSTGKQYSRVDRINLISKYPESFKSLDVCVNPIFSHKKINCSKCHKCLRTLIVLDVGRNLEKYSQVFDIPLYKKIKDKYLGQLMISKLSPLDTEAMKFYRSNGNKIPIISYYYSTKYWYAKIKKRIKSYFKN